VKPLGLLKCLGKALVRQFGNAVGFGVAGDVLVGAGEEVWGEWNREKNEQQRRDELAALVQMAAQEFRRQVAEVVQEVAAGQPEEVRREISLRLEEIPEQLRQSLRRPDDPSGRSVPPGMPLRQAQDLASLLSGRRPPPTHNLPPPARVVLTLANGPDKGRQFVFEERTSCIVGRLNECHPRFPNDEQHRAISRHHCLLDVNPPDVCLRDLGSLGGTYVNGELLDKRPQGMDRDEALKQRFRERALKDGDELRLCKHGAAVFQVSVTAPPPCALPTCARCGRDVAGETGADRPGAFLCRECRKNPAGAADTVAIQGYTILKELGRGGMGSVWLARHDRTGRQVAVKVMLPQVAADERAVKRFLLEMTNTRILNHPNVVRVEDAGFSRGVFFLTLEYCDGGSAAGLMQERAGVLPLDEAVEITLQSLEGLHYAHNVLGLGRGLVHRDLKPANLLLSGFGSARVAKVGDYGLSKAFDDAGLTGPRAPARPPARRTLWPASR
jgi:eukaryotic-like serine/threonine-protein kinase